MTSQQIQIRLNIFWYDFEFIWIILSLLLIQCLDKIEFFQQKLLLSKSKKAFCARFGSDKII